MAYQTIEEFDRDFPNADEQERVSFLLERGNVLGQQASTITGVPYSPTVLASDTITNDVIPDLNDRTKKLTESGTYDDNGQERYADGTPVPPPKDEDQTFLDNLATFNKKFGRALNDSSGIKKTTGGGIDTTNAFDEQGNVIGGTRKPTVAETKAEEQDTTIQDYFTSMKASLDAQAQRQIATIEAQYAVKKKLQEEVNRRLGEARTQALLTGGKGGSARYAPLSSAGIQAEQLTSGLLALSQLDAEEKGFINQALAAQEAGQFKILEKQVELAEAKRKEKNALATKLLEKETEATKKLKEDLIRSTRDSAIIDLHSQGITSPSEILSTLNVSGGDFTFEEVNKIVKELNAPAKTPGGPYGEYLALKESGEIPKDMKYLGPKGFLAQREEDTTKPVGGGEGVISGDVKRDADTIMSGVSPLKLGDLSTKDNYRAKVAAELNKKKEEALKSGDIIGVIRASAGGKDVSDTFLQSFEKGINVIAQISDLQNSISNEATGPIWGTIRSTNPYDVKAQTIKAQLAAIVPNLARGVYGEVGVLTDNDIKNYSKTLPTLQSLEETRNAILGITLRAVQRSLENKIKTQAGFGRDVSGIESVYKEIKDLADKTLAPLEAQNIKSELDTLNLSGTTAETAPEDFWSKAQ